MSTQGNYEHEDSSHEPGTLETLKKLQSGQLAPKAIDSRGRRQLVEYLLADGYSKAEMAAILKVSQRTIERDKAAIRQANAITSDPEMVPQMVGRLVGDAELAVQRIRKACREKTASAAVKVDAEHRCYQIVSDLVVKLQGLGYLPTAAQKLEADLIHHVGAVPDLAEIDGEVQRLKQVAATTVIEDPGFTEQLEQLEEDVTRAGLAEQTKLLAGRAARTDDSEGECDVPHN